MNIILIGMRGSGKTTVGRLLAERLGYAFVDTDEMVVTKSGKIIQDIVAQEGWEKFRDLESEVIKGAAEKDDHVIACGGGAVLREGNIKALKQNGILIWLTAPVEALAERIRNDKKAVRPALTRGANLEDELSTLLKERESKYRAVAPLAVSTTRKTLDEIVHEIVTYLKSYED